MTHPSSVANRSADTRESGGILITPSLFRTERSTTHGNNPLAHSEPPAPAGESTQWLTPRSISSRSPRDKRDRTHLPPYASGSQVRMNSRLCSATSVARSEGGSATRICLRSGTSRSRIDCSCGKVRMSLFLSLRSASSDADLARRCWRRGPEQGGNSVNDRDDMALSQVGTPRLSPSPSSSPPLALFVCLCLSLSVCLARSLARSRSLSLALFLRSSPLLSSFLSSSPPHIASSPFPKQATPSRPARLRCVADFPPHRVRCAERVPATRQGR
eukprot:607159-Rhodomonas_salina.2